MTAETKAGVTAGDETVTSAVLNEPLPPNFARSMRPSFESIEKLVDLSVPLRRPRKNSPDDSTLTQERLKELAKNNPPPAEWFEREEDVF